MCIVLEVKYFKYFNILKIYWILIKFGWSSSKFWSNLGTPLSQNHQPTPNQPADRDQPADKDQPAGRCQPVDRYSWMEVAHWPLYAHVLLNNYIVRSYRDVIVVTNTAARRIKNRV